MQRTNELWNNNIFKKCASIMIIHVYLNINKLVYVVKDFCENEHTKTHSKDIAGIQESKFEFPVSVNFVC